MRRLGPALVALMLILLPSVALGDDRPEIPDELPESLPDKYRAWLVEVDILISDEELALFLSLDKDYRRDAFIKQFWSERRGYDESLRREFEEDYKRRVQESLAQFGNLKDPRARHALINGWPDMYVEVTCRSELWPIEIFFYAPKGRFNPIPVAVIFYKPWGVGNWRRWDPFEGEEVFRNDQSMAGRSLLGPGGCNYEAFQEALAIIRLINQVSPYEYSKMMDKASQRPEPPTGEWVTTFESYSTDGPEGASTFPAEVTFSFPGYKQNRTVAQGAVVVERAVAGVTELRGSRTYNFVLNGEVLKDGSLFESFRYRFDFPVDDVSSDQMPLVFQRYLRPGDYQVILRVEDLSTNQVFRWADALNIPMVDNAMPAQDLDDEVARVYASANEVLLGGEVGVKIVRPFGDLITGFQRFDVLAEGDRIDSVQFTVDGQAVMTKKRPPYSVELDLGDLPKTLVLRATAHDDAGEEIASDELMLNASPHRFVVRLIEPVGGRNYYGSLRARADIKVPDTETLDRVELWRDDVRLATLYDEPFVQPITVPSSDLTLVRAVGYLNDGTMAEDVVIINAPDIVDEIGVDFVELYTTVLDRDRRPVSGLTIDNFSVEEDGVPQTIERFEVVDNLPIHATILLDVSASMIERLDQARDAALSFFEQLVEPRDRVSLIAFNDRPWVSVPFTHDIDDFASGVAGLKAERGTALHDSLIYSLFYANGIQGQRAVLLLSDGDDENSRFSFDDALEYSRRAEVTIYSIGLDLPARGSEARKTLRKLAEETGGRSFFIDSTAELDAVYAQIREELRSKYLLAYQSSNGSDDDQFREIDIEVSESGLDAKTISGYYP
ncbi:MAG: VWA domain-containing protein [Acidobacteriota bacterium]